MSRVRTFHMINEVSCILWLVANSPLFCICIPMTLKAAKVFFRMDNHLCPTKLVYITTLCIKVIKTSLILYEQS